MTSYIISIIVAGAMILVASIISSAIKFEGGTNPQDPSKRKMWFWILAIINPILFFLLARFIMAPKANDDQMVYDNYIKILPLATAVGFVSYVIVGFVLSKMFKNGKVGNWF